MYLSLAAYMFLQSVTPGPNNLTCLYLGASYGIKGIRLYLAGALSCLFVKSMFCGLMNILLAKYVPDLVGYLKWIGAAYMIWLAWKMAASGWKETSKENRHGDATFRSGALLQILNIKSWVAMLSVFAVYVIPVRSDLGTVLIATMIIEAVTLFNSLLWTCCGSFLRGFIGKYRKPFGVVMGFSLVYCAVRAVL